MQTMGSIGKLSRVVRSVGPALVGASVLALLAGAPGTVLAQEDMSTAAAKKSKKLTFDMVVSTAATAANCVPSAKATVTIQADGNTAEKLTIKAEGLPKKTTFDLFVIQVPNAPFGVSWYVGDLETNDSGKASATFISRFSIETFVVSPGPVAAPQTHTAASTPPSVRPPTRSTPTIWVCGSIRRPLRPSPAARPPRRRSTATTRPAFRC